MLRYHVEGDPGLPTVVFLHGFLGSSMDWFDVAGRLGPHIRWVAVDLPGHGASTGLPSDTYEWPGVVSALEQVLDRVGVDRCTLVGYSMGGRIALYFAVERPDRIRRLVLESASPGLGTTEARAARIASDEALAAQLEGGDLEGFLDAWYRQPLFAPLMSDPVRAEAIREKRRRNDPLELARALRGLGTGGMPPLWGRLADVGYSVLAVAGAHDGKYVEVAQQMWLQNARIRRAVIPNAGHCVHAEVPEAFTELLLDFQRQP